jgi:hypothetical protein
MIPRALDFHVAICNSNIPWGCKIIYYFLT